MQPAARVGDDHTCKEQGGPIDTPGSRNVDTNGNPQARASDKLMCSGVPKKDVIFTGSKSVEVNGLPAARKGDLTSHHGKITEGSPDVEIGGGTVYVMKYDHEVRVGGSAAWRNNNPGNIVAGKFATNHDAIGSDGRFAVFPDEATGRSALASLLKGDAYQNLSIVGAMNKYAPPSENDTRGYLNALRHATGLDTNRTIGSLSDDELQSFTSAIRQHEGWIPGTTVSIPGGGD